MNDQAPPGSGSAEAPKTGTPETPPAIAEKGSAAEAATPFAGLSEGTRQWVTTKGYKSIEDVAAAAQSSETKIGSMISLPGQDAKPEELDKFYSKLGRPDTADKYEFKRPEGLPADLPYSDDLAKAAKPWMHEAGLNSKQAQLVHDKFVTYQADQMKAAQAAVAKSVEDTHDALVKEWGPKDSEGFKQKHALADRAVKKLGLTEAFQKSGIVLPDGALTNAQLAKAFSAIGEAMFKEDTIDEKAGAQGGDNPFKRDADGSIKSPGAISALIKSDPERAKRLAREAGENLAHWFPENPR